MRYDGRGDVVAELVRAAFPRRIHPDQERLHVGGVDTHRVVKQRYIGAAPERGMQRDDRLDDVTHLIDGDPGNLVAGSVLAEILEEHDGLTGRWHHIGEVARRLRNVHEPGNVVEERGLALIHSRVDPDLPVGLDGVGELHDDGGRLVSGRTTGVLQVEADQDAQDAGPDGSHLERGHRPVGGEVPAGAQHVREPRRRELLGDDRKRSRHDSPIKRCSTGPPRSPSCRAIERGL